MKILVGLFYVPVMLFSSSMLAQNINVTIELLSAEGHSKIGIIGLKDSDFGLVLTPNLSSLTPGMHGFHVHQIGSCTAVTKEGKMVLGGAAGGHYDPDNTGKHGLPWTTDNHQGDLPALFVNGQGSANTAVLAPRLKVKDVQGLSLMVHLGGDNHSDHPLPLGGGGGRMACGVIK